VGERVCLRCDWTGGTGGETCPRCGAPLYRVLEPTTPREAAPAPRPQPQPAGDPMPSSPIDMVQDDESVPPAVPVISSRRWWVIGGGAFTVTAVLIVATGLLFDRTQTAAVPGPMETGAAETGAAETATAETAPPPALAPGADVLIQGTCSNRARWWLELMDIGDRIEVRFELHRSPVGHSWHIRLSHDNGVFGPGPWRSPFFEGTRVASDSGDLVVERRVVDAAPNYFFKSNAWDAQTGQVCKAIAGGA
jgi:hypothetical protein